jgi:cobalt-zinc-cadmium resistance protein CzcA
MELRTLLEWEIGMKLRAVPGVVEVNIWGGEPRAVSRHSGSREDCSPTNCRFTTFSTHSNATTPSPAGAISNINANNCSSRGEALATQVARDLVEDCGGARFRRRADLHLRRRGGPKEASALRIGAATAMGEGETVIGMVQMFAGENAQQACERGESSSERN